MASPLRKYFLRGSNRKPPAPRRRLTSGDQQLGAVSGRMGARRRSAWHSQAARSATRRSRVADADRRPTALRPVSHPRHGRAGLHADLVARRHAHRVLTLRRPRSASRVADPRYGRGAPDLVRKFAWSLDWAPAGGLIAADTTQEFPRDRLILSEDGTIVRRVGVDQSVVRDRLQLVAGWIAARGRRWSSS